MTRTRAKLQDVLDGIDFVTAGQSTEHSAYLCKKTGQVLWASDDLDELLPDDLENSEQYIPLPHKNNLDLGKSLAMRFVREFLPDSASRVAGFFSRSGAYASFKFLLERRGMLQQWYEYERKAIESVVREWCKDNNVEIDG